VRRSIFGQRRKKGLKKGQVLYAFHILVRMFPEYEFTDEDILKRYVDFYGEHTRLISSRKATKQELNAHWEHQPGPRDSGSPFIDLSPMPNRENQDDYIFILELA